MAQRGRDRAVADEFEGAEFGDVRLTARLKALSVALSAAPSSSFPKVLSPAELEGAYRFLRNESVSLQAILEPHAAATAQRAAAECDVLVVHDTTIISFTGEGGRGLTPIVGNKPGFSAHVSLALSHAIERKPLGVLAVSTLVRPLEKVPETPNESARWWAHIEQTDARLNARARVVHVMDREGDSYELFHRCLAGNYRFVVRLAHNRMLKPAGKGDPRKLFDALEQAQIVAHREVPLSRQGKRKAPQDTKHHPPRAARRATLAIAATTVSLKRPDHAAMRAKDVAESLTVNVVYVREVDAPPGTTPVRWMLVTSDPIGTAEEILAVVDRYRARWTIEEYFKALKTGCAYESRQLESAHSLLNALGVFVPLAWKVLRLRSEARRAPEDSADTVLDATELRVLRHFTRIKLSDKPSVREAMLAIAALGGHLKHNGEPGWQTLWAGQSELDALCEGWRAALSSQRSDQ